MSRIINKKSNIITIDSGHAERRIDNFLLAHLKTVPKSRIYQMLRRGEVRINGGRVKQGYRLQAGDQLRLPPVRVQQQLQSSAPEYLLKQVQDAIIYEDANLLVINKPAGLVVHSGSGRSHGVIELLRQHRQTDKEELQLVHRLDQDTSGCLLLARSMPVLRRLHDIFQAGEVEKVYQSLLIGVMRQTQRVVDAALNDGRVISGERMVAVDPGGKPAVSHFQLLQSFMDTSYVSVRIDTGRTHQIRVHARHIGHPVAGDKKYGDKEANKRLRQLGLKRLFLHASELCFPDPVTGNQISVSAVLPTELEDLLDRHQNEE